MNCLPKILLPIVRQIAERMTAYSKYMNFDIAVIFGGVGDNPQKKKLRAVGYSLFVCVPMGGQGNDVM